MNNIDNVSKETILYFFFDSLCFNAKIVDKRNKKFKEGYLSNKHYTSNLSILNDRIKHGWKLEDIKLSLLEAKRLNTKVTMLNELIPFNPPVKSLEDNLIHGKCFHKILKKVTPPIYGEEGLINPGEVSRVELFTLNDLIKYYFNVLKPQVINRKEVTGVLTYLLNSGTLLDDILSAIDLWAYRSSDTIRGNDPWQLSKEYIPEVREERFELQKCKKI